MNDEGLIKYRKWNMNEKRLLIILDSRSTMAYNN